MEERKRLELLGALLDGMNTMSLISTCGILTLILKYYFFLTLGLENADKEEHLENEDIKKILKGINTMSLNSTCDI